FTTGPLAVPGSYTAHLHAGGTTSTSTFRVLPDPRSTASAADLEAQLVLGLEVRDAISRLSHAVRRLQSVRKQLADRDALLVGEGVPKNAGSLIEGSKKLAERLDTIEHRLHNPDAKVSYDILAQPGGAQLYSLLMPLMSWTTSGSGAPTQGMREEFAR